jgi:hypothetical protein
VTETTSTIHDLGYKRYVGTRRPPSTRWRVIMRHQIATGWKTWWRYKVWLGLAVINTVIAAAFIFIATDKQWGAVKLADFALPFSIDLYIRAAFFISLTIGAGVIAGDIQSGAFTFYFARSTRPIDYLAGKLAGYGMLIAIPVIGGPFVVACMRLGLVGWESTSELLTQLELLPKTIAIGAVATVAYTAVPLGFSAIVPNRRYALGIWAAYYLVVGSIIAGIGFLSKSDIAAVDLATSVKSFANNLLDVGGRGFRISTTAALVSIGAHVGLAIAVIWWQLVTAQKAGVGGAT